MAINPDSIKNLKPGNKRGPSKSTALLKDAILQAAEAAGGQGGMVGYLTLQAHENPGPFLALMGKVLPLQIAGDKKNPIQVEHTAGAKLLSVIDAIAERR